LFAKPGPCGVFLVEDVESPEADVRNLLLAKKDFVTW
jgi:hypothetical protein